jgi:hypothetical protein
MFTRDELIEALEKEGLHFDEKCDFSEGGQIKWESRFDEIEAEHYETGFAPEMACDITDSYIDFCSILNSEIVFFERDTPIEVVVEASKKVVEKFYLDLL